MRRPSTILLLSVLLAVAPLSASAQSDGAGPPMQAPVDPPAEPVQDATDEHTDEQADEQVTDDIDAPVAASDDPDATDVHDSKVPLAEIRRYVAVYRAIKEAYVDPVDDRTLM